MQENIEVNNPMYIQDDIDDEDINLDRSFPLQEKVTYYKVLRPEHSHFNALKLLFYSQVDILETQYMTLCTVLVAVHQLLAVKKAKVSYRVLI